MSASTTTHSPTGNELVLAALLDAPDRTLTNVQLGAVPGVQAFRSRVADLRRQGFVLPSAVKVAEGRYAYRLAGAYRGTPAAQAHPSLPAVDYGNDLDVESESIARIKANRERLAHAGDAIRPAKSMARELATAREEAAFRGEQIDRARKAIAEALRKEPGEQSLDDLIGEVVAALEHGRRPRARRVNADRGPSGPDLMRRVLEEAGVPLHSTVIAERVMANGGDAVYHGLTPAATMAAQLATSNKKGGDFVKVAPGCFAIREWPAAKRDAEPVRA